MKIRNIKQKTILAVHRFLSQTGIRNKKVFAVGFNKSGTTSLHTLFKSLGLRSYHGLKWRGCDDLKLLNSYNCFSDDIPHDLAKLDSLFPSSKFILQLRGLDSWIYSRLAHIERGKEEKTYILHPEWDNTEYAIKAWIKKRNAHHLFVLSYFSERPFDLLVVNYIRDKSAATKIYNFLGYEGKYERTKTNINPRKELVSNHTMMLAKCIAELGISKRDLKYDIYCPSLESSETQLRFPVDSSLLEIDRK